MIFTRTLALAATTALASCRTSDPGQKGGTRGSGRNADGFIAHADGSVVFRGPGDTSDQTIPVVAGGHYPISIASIVATTDVGITLGWLK